jgi:GT2 family glycosyltransferase
MSVAAIIVTYNTGPVLADCLSAVAAAAGCDEIIIVDNGNAEPEVQVLDAFALGDSRVQLLRGQGNVGFAAGCNKGTAQARSDVLAFINPDAVLTPGAINALVAALDSAPPPAIVGGDLRDGEGRPDRGSRRDRLTLWRAWVSFSGLSRLERFSPLLRDFNRHRDPLPARATPVGAVSGALMLVRRMDFSALGGFDEGYFLHVEDIDLCRRAEQSGWRVLFEPGPHGRHFRSSSDVGAAAVTRHKALGMSRYLAKFARSPLERALSKLAGGALVALSSLGARPKD